MLVVGDIIVHFLDEFEGYTECEVMQIMDETTPIRYGLKSCKTGYRVVRHLDNSRISKYFTYMIVERPF